MEISLRGSQLTQGDPAPITARRDDTVAAKTIISSDKYTYYRMPRKFVDQFKQWQMEVFGEMVSEWVDVTRIGSPKNYCLHVKSPSTLQDQQPLRVMSNNSGLVPSELNDSSLAFCGSCAVANPMIDLASSPEEAVTLIASLADKKSFSSAFPSQGSGSYPWSMPFDMEDGIYCNSTVGFATSSAATQSSCFDDLFMSNVLSPIAGDTLSHFGMLSAGQPTNGIVKQLLETPSRNVNGLQSTIGMPHRTIDHDWGHFPLDVLI